MVSPTESVAAALTRNWEMIDSALEGMDEAALARQPSEQCNSVAWILWHLSRVMDTAVHTRIRETPQLWISESWHDKFSMSADPDDRGVGWTAVQVASWKAPAREVLLGYYGVIKAAVTEFLASATPAELEKKVVWPPVAEPRTVAAAFGQVTWDAIAHGGQIAYLRGLYLGMGWHR